MDAITFLIDTIGHSRPDLAKKLGVPVEKLAKFAQPETCSRNDLIPLAVLLETSVDDILGDNPFESRFASRMLPYGNEEGPVTPFWGNVGIKVLGMDTTRWYAVTTDTYDHVVNSLDEEFVVMPTLDNRLVVFSPDRVQHVWFVSEAMDSVADWDKTNGAGTTGRAGVLFDGLEAWCNEQEGFGEEWDTWPEAHKPAVVSLGEAMGLERVTYVIEETEVFCVDGDSHIRHYSAGSLATFYDAAENGGVGRMVGFTTEYGRDERYIPATRLALVDMPLRLVARGVNEDINEDLNGG